MVFNFLQICFFVALKKIGGRLLGPQDFLMSSSSKKFSIIATETLKFWSLAVWFWYLLTVNGAFGANTEWKNGLNSSALLWVVLADFSLYFRVSGIPRALFIYFKFPKISLVFLVPNSCSWYGPASQFYDAIDFAIFEHFHFKCTHFVLPVGSGTSS